MLKQSVNPDLSGNKKIKVFLLQDFITNYRIPVYQRLAKLKNIDFTFFYSNITLSRKKEGFKHFNNPRGFKHIKIKYLIIGKKFYQFSFLKYIILKNPDVVICGKLGSLDTLFFLLFCKFLNISVLWWAGGVPFIDNEKIKEYSMRGRLNKIFGKKNPKLLLSYLANGMIVYSEHAKIFYHTIGFKKPIFVAPNSTDTDLLLSFKENILKTSNIFSDFKKKYAPNNEKIIFSLGRLSKERKTNKLIDAFEIVQKEYPLCTLIIIGDGSERSKLEHIVNEKKMKNVNFLGEIYDDEILSKYFMLCDVFTPVIGSLSLKMAMTFGKPVISFAYGLEIHCIENGKNGFIIDIDNTKDMAEKILLLFKDDKLREEMGKNAEKTINEKININKMIEGFEKAIYQTNVS